MLVHEKGLTLPDGNELPRGWVGLRRVNEHIRTALSPELRSYLDGMEEWIGYMENYRHALAHRIPLYVPPFMVTPANTPAYQDLEQRMWEALRRGEVDEHGRLTAEQAKLTFFRPFMAHSFEEQKGIVTFHPQLLADFNTVEAIGRKVLEELDRR
jgi:hypothetical protein